MTKYMKEKNVKMLFQILHEPEYLLHMLGSGMCDYDARLINST